MLIVTVCEFGVVKFDKVYEKIIFTQNFDVFILFWYGLAFVYSLITRMFFCVTQELLNVRES